MRFVALSLLSLLLVTGICIAAWSACVALRRGPSRTTKAPPVIGELQRPEAPARLPTSPAFARPADASATTAGAATTPVEIRVRNLPEALRTGSSGVATFVASTGAGFTWMPLAEATSAADGDLVVHARVHTGEQCIVTLATARAFAQHGYLARTQLGGGAEATGEVALDVAVSTIRFELPANARRAGPFRLVRVDDPQWLPMHHGSTGISLAQGAVSVLLGAGQYELCDPIAPGTRQRFDVPAPGPIVLSDSLSGVRADRF
jgi:hypothetical protein